jgi:hypothetical protein
VLSRRYETYDFRLLRVSCTSAAPIRAYSGAKSVCNALWIVAAGQAHLQVVLHNQTSPAQLVAGCAVHAYISYHDLFVYLGWCCIDRVSKRKSPKKLQPRSACISGSCLGSSGEKILDPSVDCTRLLELLRTHGAGVHKACCGGQEHYCLPLQLLAA